MTKYSAIGMFCDDVREEKAGTVSLIGILPDNIYVPKERFAFPKIGMYMRVNWPTSEAAPSTLTLSLHTQDGKRVLGEADASTIQKSVADGLARGSPNSGVIAQAVFTNMVVKPPFRLNLVCNVDDTEIIAATLNVLLTESQPSID